MKDKKKKTDKKMLYNSFLKYLRIV